MPYSDNGVDQRVAEIFDGFVGHACDVGANDGALLSNSLMFEELGWTVLCVEPNPMLAKKGRAFRKLWRQVACGAVDAEDVDFHAVGGHYTYASYSALDTTGVQWNVPDHMIFKCRVRTLDWLLDEAGFPRLDYLTLDVESWERAVMAGFTVEKWKPKVIVLEEWTENAIVIPGYTIIEKKQFDNLYVRD